MFMVVPYLLMGQSEYYFGKSYKTAGNCYKRFQSPKLCCVFAHPHNAIGDIPERWCY